MASVVGTDIALITTVVIGFEDVQNACVAVAVAVGSLGEVSIIKVLDVANVGKSNPVSMLADDSSDVVVGVSIQRTRTQGQAVIGIVNHL